LLQRWNAVAVLFDLLGGRPVAHPAVESNLVKCARRVSQGGDVLNTDGLDSPTEVYFFSKKPENYTSGDRNYSYEISNASEQTLDNAEAMTLSAAKMEIIQFAEPTVDVQGKNYIYVVRSKVSREEFANVMSPEPTYKAKGVQGLGIRGLHYSASERYGDAIGITVEAATPQGAKEQFQTWYASIKAALKALGDRFAVLNKEIERQIEELAAQRRDELNRSKSAL
jgi:hypothetical protein